MWSEDFRASYMQQGTWRDGGGGKDLDPLVFPALSL